MSQPRNVTINIRAQQNQRDLIDSAAEIQGKSRSEFMIEASYQKAQDVVLDQCLFAMDEAQYQKFVELLDAPPLCNQSLHSLLSAKAPWD